MSSASEANAVGICITGCSVAVALLAESLWVGLASLFGLALVDFWIESLQRRQR